MPPPPQKIVFVIKKLLLYANGSFGPLYKLEVQTAKGPGSQCKNLLPFLVTVFWLLIRAPSTVILIHSGHAPCDG